MSPQRTSSGGSGVDVATLAITAVASAAAAYACSKIWAPGTLGAAATTPVLVALIREMLTRPTEVVTRAVPLRGVVRSSGGPEEGAAPPAGLEESERLERIEQVGERVAQPGEIPGSSRPYARGRAVRMAVITGLLGFVLAAAIITLPELVAGSSASGGGRDTTFFGGSRDRAASKTTTTETTTAPTTTDAPAETVTVPPAETVTVPPAQTTPVPEERAPVAPEATVPQTTTVPPEDVAPQPPPPPG